MYPMGSVPTDALAVLNTTNTMTIPLVALATGWSFPEEQLLINQIKNESTSVSLPDAVR